MPKQPRKISPEQLDAYEASIERIKDVTNARTQVQLAEVLDVRQSSISDAKRRASVPDGWLVKLLETHGVLPAWIKTGNGPKYLAGAAQEILSAHMVRLGLIHEDYARIVCRMEDALELINMSAADLQRKKDFHAGAISVELQRSKAFCAELSSMATEAAILSQ